MALYYVTYVFMDVWFLSLIFLLKININYPLFQIFFNTQLRNLWFILSMFQFPTLLWTAYIYNVHDVLYSTPWTFPPIFSAITKIKDYFSDVPLHSEFANFAQTFFLLKDAVKNILMGGCHNFRLSPNGLDQKLCVSLCHVKYWL